MIDVKNDRAKRTLRLTVVGAIKLDEVKAAAVVLKRETDSYNGAPHMVLADMRGMKAVAPDAADVIGAAMVYQRQHGVVHCAHLSDSSTVRLQAARLARQAAEGDPGITEVISIEEGERVLDEILRKLPPLG